MRQYNAGDPPGVGLEKRFDAIWEVRAHDARDISTIFRTGKVQPKTKQKKPGEKKKR